MLLKNEKQVDFTKNQEIEKSELKNILGRKETIVFRLVDKLSKPGPRGTKTYKRRHLIEAFYHTRDNNGNTSEYRYCKSKRPGKNFNETIYAPEMLTFENGGEIKINIGKDQKNNLDLLIFLLKHPRRASGPTAKNVENPLFFFIDENAQALQYIQKRELASDMDALLMNKNTRLSDEELIIIAEALAIPNVDEMNTARVQVEIQKRCKNNPQRFLILAKLDKETEMRANIQKGMEAGVLNFDNSNLKWLIIDGDHRAVLLPIRKSDDKVDALVHFLKNQDDNDHYGKIVELVKESKLQTVKG